MSFRLCITCDNDRWYATLYWKRYFADLFYDEYLETSQTSLGALFFTLIPENQHEKWMNEYLETEHEYIQYSTRFMFSFQFCCCYYYYCLLNFNSSLVCCFSASVFALFWNCTPLRYCILRTNKIDLNYFRCMFVFIILDLSFTVSFISFFKNPFKCYFFY